nr:flagellar brake protein [uncultured Pseudodesulfovibrio sp.]
MHIESGSRIIVEYADKERMNCRYVGQSKGEFLLLKVPITPGIRERLVKGTHLQVRYLGAGRIVGFSVDVISYQAAPVSLVFLTYPTEFVEHNLRQEDRMTCHFPATVSVNEDVYSGHISDISPGGCCFVLADVSLLKLETKTPVAGTFQTMEGQKPYSFTGEFMTRCEAGPHQGLGIRFQGDVVLPEGVSTFFSEMVGAEENSGESS